MIDSPNKPSHTNTPNTTHQLITYKIKDGKRTPSSLSQLAYEVLYTNNPLTNEPTLKSQSPTLKPS
jgi:hypothetical protein